MDGKGGSSPALEGGQHARRNGQGYPTSREPVVQRRSVGSSGHPGVRFRTMSSRQAMVAPEALVCGDQRSSGADPVTGSVCPG